MIALGLITHKPLILIEVHAIDLCGIFAVRLLDEVLFGEHYVILRLITCLLRHGWQIFDAISVSVIVFLWRLLVFRSGVDRWRLLLIFNSIVILPDDKHVVLNTPTCSGVLTSKLGLNGLSILF